ncbi:MAG: hypothetical protein HWE13_04145 [Gammaproteobacteria bacterium]|nr:hypothetical protein [Gammaproteobacteria bacterium]NVK87288.1 hypothetical protein [Gammaproteobacteria bacterium]
MQQVNLYLEQFKPKVEYLSFEQFLMSAAALLLLYLGLGWMLNADLDTLKSQVNQERKMLEQMKAQLTELESMIANRPSQAGLDSQISRLEYDIQKKQLALNTFQDADVSASGGFSNIIEDLARNDSRDIWLTKIDIQDDTLVLSGQTLKPEMITEWIKTMSRHASLNRQYLAIELEQNQWNERVYDFKLSGGVAVKHE